ncbi:MAG: ATP-binding cassette domain-containing protein [bacterium]|nr:ATP-binding cassette domain-containing protein [bacterium]
MIDLQRVVKSLYSLADLVFCVEMWYLQVENLTKVYVDKPIVDQLSFSLLQGQKVALVAKNGGGKTTLLKLIMGELDKTDGKVEFRKGIKI